MVRRGTRRTVVLEVAVLVVVAAVALTISTRFRGSGVAVANLPPVVSPTAHAAIGQQDDFRLVPGATALSRPGDPQRLVIPAIGLDSAVKPVGIVYLRGRPEWDTADHAAGYHQGTGAAGRPGNVVLAGHISSPIQHKGNVFRALPQVRIGDLIEVYAGGRMYTYRVDEVKVVEPTRVQVMAPTPDARVTLITCYPDHIFSHRLVVVGTLQRAVTLDPRPGALGA